MNILVVVNIGGALLWIAVWGGALTYNLRLLRIYRADREKIRPADDPILAIQARGRVHRLTGRVLGSVGLIFLGALALWGRLAAGGQSLTLPGALFSVVIIAGALGVLAQCREEVRDRAAMEHLAAQTPDPTN